MRLDRLGTVRRDTVMVLLGRDRPPEVKGPGELVIPSWFPWRGGRDAMLVNTRPVTVPVTVTNLLTLDGEDLASVEVHLQVRLRPAAIADLVAEHGAEFGQHLSRTVERSVESSVRAAVGMNRSSDLRRQTLARVLSARWLPTSFGHGALELADFTVDAVRWPDDRGSAQPEGPVDDLEPSGTPGQGAAADARTDAASGAVPLGREGSVSRSGSSPRDPAKRVGSTERGGPAERDRSAERDGPIERDRSAERDGPTERDRSAERDGPTERDRSAERDRPAQRRGPAERDGSANDVGAFERDGSARPTEDGTAGPGGDLVDSLGQPEDGFGPLLPVGPLGRGRRHRVHRSADSALKLVYVPLVISVVAFWLFFIFAWVPEFQSFPGADLVLEQMAPLASEELTSASRPLVASQQGHRGFAAAFLLVVSLMLPPLARSRWWVARLSLWPLTYLATVAALVTVIGALVRGQGGTSLLGLLLLGVWVGTAVVTTWRSLWVDVDALPRRPTRVAWLLGVFALVNVAPVALGRCLFAPELRTAALAVAPNDLTLRWAALLTPTTALVYLSGMSVAVVVWAGYLLWPPRRIERRRLALSALAVGLIGLLLIAPQAAVSGQRRAAVISNESPRDEIGFTCGSWVNQPAGQPAQTLVVNGLGCKRITAFAGYHEVSSREAVESLSPIRAKTGSVNRIVGRLVGAAYGDVVVLASTDRMDRQATSLIGLGTADGIERWRFRCPATNVMSLRFARSSDGDDSSAGRLTLRGERSAVIVDCGQGAVRLNPHTGTSS